MGIPLPKPDATVLVIDDEPQIRRLLRVTLESGGYRILDAATGAEGLALVAQYQPDAVLLDLGLPDLDGMTVLQRLREWSRVPVIILTVRDREDDKIAALDGGADDYVTKPFGTRELLARLRAALRHGNLQAPCVVFKAGDMQVDLAARKVTRGRGEVKLTPIEYALLQLLVSHAGKVLTHGQLLAGVWGPRATDKTHYLRVHIAHLRSKLEPDPSQPTLILTESAIGYRLVEPEDR